MNNNGGNSIFGKPALSSALDKVIRITDTGGISVDDFEIGLNPIKYSLPDQGPPAGKYVIESDGTSDLVWALNQDAAGVTFAGDAPFYESIAVFDDNTGKIIKSGNYNVEFIRRNLKFNKFDAIGPPTGNNDASEGYGAGSAWIDIVANKAYICVADQVGVAVWQDVDNSTFPTMTAQNIQQGANGNVNYKFPTAAPTGGGQALISTGGGITAWANIPSVGNVLQRETIFQTPRNYDDPFTGWSVTGDEFDGTNFNAVFTPFDTGSDEKYSQFRNTPNQHVMALLPIYNSLTDPLFDTAPYYRMTQSGGNPYGIKYNHIYREIDITGFNKQYDHIELSVYLNATSYQSVRQNWNIYVQYSKTVGSFNSPIFNQEFLTDGENGRIKIDINPIDSPYSNKNTLTQVQVRLNPQKFQENVVMQIVFEAISHVGVGYNNYDTQKFGASIIDLDIWGYKTDSGNGVILPTAQIDHNLLLNHDANRHLLADNNAIDHDSVWTAQKINDELALKSDSTYVDASILSLNNVVSTNETDIENKVSALNGIVSANETDIETKLITANALIALNETDIENKVIALNGLVATNETDIENKVTALNGLVVLNENDIENKVTALNGIVSTNETDIENKVTTLNGIVSANETDIENKVIEVTALVVLNETDIENKVTALNGIVAANETDIENKVTALNGIVAVNETDIENKLTVSNTAIALNSTVITNLTNTVTANKTDVDASILNITTTMNENIVLENLREDERDVELSNKADLVDGVLKLSQLPISSNLEVKGVWDASLNDPTLSNLTGHVGDLYFVGTGGNANLGSGSVLYDTGDQILYGVSGTWEVISSHLSINDLSVSTSTTYSSSKTTDIKNSLQTSINTIDSTVSGLSAIVNSNETDIETKISAANLTISNNKGIHDAYVTSNNLTVTGNKTISDAYNTANDIDKVSINDLISLNETDIETKMNSANVAILDNASLINVNELDIETKLNLVNNSIFVNAGVHNSYVTSNDNVVATNKGIHDSYVVSNDAIIATNKGLHDAYVVSNDLDKVQLNDLIVLNENDIETKMSATNLTVAGNKTISDNYNTANDLDKAAINNLISVNETDIEAKISATNSTIVTNKGIHDSYATSTDSTIAANKTTSDNYNTANDLDKAAINNLINVNETDIEAKISATNLTVLNNKGIHDSYVVSNNLTVAGNKTISDDYNTANDLDKVTINNLISLNETDIEAKMTAVNDLVVSNKNSSDLSLSGKANLINGFLDPAELPLSVLTLKGIFNPDIPDPNLLNGVGVDGDLYLVSNAGYHDFGLGQVQLKLSDHVLYFDDVYHVISAGQGVKINDSTASTTSVFSSLKTNQLAAVLTINHDALVSLNTNQENARDLEIAAITAYNTANDIDKVSINDLIILNENDIEAKMSATNSIIATNKGISDAYVTSNNLTVSGNKTLSDNYNTANDIDKVSINDLIILNENDIEAKMSDTNLTVLNNKGIHDSYVASNNLTVAGNKTTSDNYNTANDIDKVSINDLIILNENDIETKMSATNLTLSNNHELHNTYVTSNDLSVLNKHDEFKSYETATNTIIANMVSTQYFDNEARENAMTDHENNYNKPNGYLKLDGNQRIPSIHMNVNSIVFKGSYNPATNTPDLVNPAAPHLMGDYYIINADAAGIILGLNDIESGDAIVYDSNIPEWVKLDNSLNNGAGVGQVSINGGVMNSNRIVQTNGSSALVTADLASGYNKNFGTASGTVMEGTMNPNFTTLTSPIVYSNFIQSVGTGNFSIRSNLSNTSSIAMSTNNTIYLASGGSTNLYLQNSYTYFQKNVRFLGNIYLECNNLQSATGNALNYTASSHIFNSDVSIASTNSLRASNIYSGSTGGNIDMRDTVLIDKTKWMHAALIKGWSTSDLKLSLYDTSANILLDRATSSIINTATEHKFNIGNGTNNLKMTLDAVGLNVVDKITCPYIDSNDIKIKNIQAISQNHLFLKDSNSVIRQTIETTGKIILDSTELDLISTTDISLTAPTVKINNYVYDPVIGCLFYDLFQSTYNATLTQSGEIKHFLNWGDSVEFVNCSHGSGGEIMINRPTAGNYELSYCFNIQTSAATAHGYFYIKVNNDTLSRTRADFKREVTGTHRQTVYNAVIVGLTSGINVLTLWYQAEGASTSIILNASFSAKRL